MIRIILTRSGVRRASPDHHGKDLEAVQAEASLPDYRAHIMKDKFVRRLPAPDVTTGTELVRHDEVSIMKHAVWLIAFFLGIVLSTSCLDARTQQKPAALTSASSSTPNEENKKVSIAELKRLYANATSELDRRAVCLRAIDEGAIYRTGPISLVDEIFGTHFASTLPTKRDKKGIGVIDFAAQPQNGPSNEAVAHTGWFMAVEYDDNGDIQNYYLTNLHK